MKYEVRESEEKRGHYVVLAIDPEHGGEVHSVLFSGANAREQAEEYAAWKNREVNDVPNVAPLSR